MRRVYALFLVLSMSLFIISAKKFSREPNGDLDAYNGEDDPFQDTYIEYISVDTHKPIPTGNLGRPDVYLITTNIKTKEKTIKNTTPLVPYGQFNGEGGFPIPSGYAVVNKEYFLNYIVPSSDKERLSQWFAASPYPTKPTGDFFAEPVVIYSPDAILGEDPYDAQYHFEIVSLAFYLPFTDEYGDGTRLIMKADDLPVYDYDVILQGDADKLTDISFKNTVVVTKTILNVR